MDNNDYYKIIGVERNASEEDIRRQYRKKAIIHHPDKGGSEAEFKMLSTAYNVLSDPEKRKIYDKHGTNDIDIGDNNIDPYEVFTNTFGVKRVNPLDVHVAVDVDLSYLYNGHNLTVNFERNIPCTDCSGNGKTFSGTLFCNTCNGSGKVIFNQQVGVVDHKTIIRCHRCKGSGKIVIDPKTCSSCEGNGFVTQEVSTNVHIPKGIPDSESIVIYGKGHVLGDGRSGNLVINIIIKQHRFFNRKGDLLVMKKHISIADAVCGFTFYLQHLDKHILKISIPHGMVVSPNSVYKVRGEGMPTFGYGGHGDLIIQFVVDFPQKVELTLEQITKLKEIFSGISTMQGDIKYDRCADIEHINADEIQDNPNINCSQQ